MPLVYGAFQQLGWIAQRSSDSQLIGFTKKTWNRPHNQVLVVAVDGQVAVTSQSHEAAAWDLLQKNKKNVARFLTAFNEVKDNATLQQVQDWGDALAMLQEETGADVEREQREVAEAEALMNLSSGNRTVTYALIGINGLLFVLMALRGVNLFEPATEQLVGWGANYRPLTTGGEWWRLLTSTFIHIGIIHLLFNMYALYQAGGYLEPMLGRRRFLAAYFCTGILASVSSTWWHGNESVSAGASGAIFGLYGVFLALLTTKLIPQTVRKALLQSIGVFVVYNLLFGAGLKAVDNAAHLGGLFSGLAIGYAYFFTFRNDRFRPAIAMVLAITATALLSFSYLRAAHNDDALYNKKVDEVLAIQERAIAPLKNYTSNADLLSKLATISQPEWARAKQLADETAAYQLDPKLARHRKLLVEYLALRIQLNDLSIISLQGNENVDAELEQLTRQVNEKVAEMQNR